MSTKRWDVIAIGGGHNSLTAAAYLAKAGLSVLVLEKRPLLGGTAVTEEFAPGFKVDSVLHQAGMLHPQISKDLFLPMHGLTPIEINPVIFSPTPAGQSLTLSREPATTAVAIGQLSQRDGRRFTDYAQMMNKYTAVLESALGQIPPNLTALGDNNPVNWLGVVKEMMGLNADDIYGLLRILPMSAEEFLSEWFEHPLVQGTLAAAGVSHIQQGPMSGGTAFVLLYHHLGQRLSGLPSSSYFYGGMGNLTSALASAAQQFGATIRTETEVAQILIENGRSVGVKLTSGEEIQANVVVSGTNPYHTFTELIDPYELDPTFINGVRNIKFRGAVAKLHLALDGLPTFTAVAPDETWRLNGRLQISPSIPYLEKAYDAAKYGRFSAKPYLDIRIPSLTDPTFAPEGQHVMSISAQYAPYQLRDGRWDDQRDNLRDTILDTLAEYAPKIKEHILHHQLLTPADLESKYGLHEGAIYHGEMMFDQLLFMRPVPGWGQYRTPIDNMYVCGAGSHPGGGITGKPGRLAAQQILNQM